MKNKAQLLDTYNAPTISTPYDEEHLPQPLPVPKEVSIDKEEWYGSDNESLGVLPSRAEVTLSKHIRPGFIHDFVLALRATEAPTLFSIWGALFVLSSAMQRRTWQDWVIERLYPNLYVVFLARPGICKKTTSVMFGAKVIQRLPDVFRASEDKAIFGIPMWYGGSTPEFLFDLLAPKTITTNGGISSMPENIHLGSRLAVVVDEMSEFLGRQKYNQGMISRLTRLYDCRDKDQLGTKKEGVQELENVFFNFAGGTTPDSFRDVIPAEAKGGGFMSRCIVLWQEARTRSFHRPQRIRGLPDPDELARRLAWIAEHRTGEYRMTPEADELYHDWYNQHKGEMNSISDADTRQDILLVKTAHLVALSGYKQTQYIEAEDILAAIELIEHASQQKTKAEHDLLVSEGWSDKIHTVERLLERRGGMKRVDLVRSVSRKMNTDEVNKVLIALQQGGKIAIELHGMDKTLPSNSGEETYSWQFTQEN